MLSLFGAAVCAGFFLVSSSLSLSLDDDDEDDDESSDDGKIMCFGPSFFELKFIN